MNFEKGVYLHLLAIYAQELLAGPEPQDNPRMSRDWKKLARLYLRTAWMFREENPEEDKSSSEQDFLFKLQSSIDSLIDNQEKIKTNWRIL